MREYIEDVRSEYRWHYQSAILSDRCRCGQPWPCARRDELRVWLLAVGDVETVIAP